MKQVVDSQGIKISGLFKTESGSLVVQDTHGFFKNRASHGVFSELKDEISDLREKLNEIMSFISTLNK